MGVIFVSYERPSKKNIFRHLKQNVDDSNNGLKIMLKESSTFHRIYPLMIVAAVALGLIFHFNALEYIILGAIFIFDVVTETMNSAVEEVCDRVTLEKDERIKRSKDIASAAVYIAHLSYIAAFFFFLFSHIFGFQWWTAIIPA